MIQRVASSRASAQTVSLWVVLGLTACGRDEEVATVPAASAWPETIQVDPEIPRRPVVVGPGRGTTRMQRFSMGPAAAKSAGLTEDEAAWEGDWDWNGARGIALDPDRTFVYWARVPETAELSRGTWSVHEGRLVLAHSKVRGKALESPLVTEHPRFDVGTSELLAPASSGD